MPVKIIKKIAILLFWLAVWHLIAEKVAMEFILPSPRNTYDALKELVKRDEFFISVFTSLTRILRGFNIGVGVGLLCGIFSAKSRFFKEMSAPILTLVKTVPVASFILLALYWFKSTELPIFIAALMVLPIIRSGLETAL